LALLSADALLALTPHPWLLASLGGSSVILLGMPRGSMAQPRSFLGGHLLSTAVALTMHALARRLGGPVEMWAACAVAAALVVFAEDASWWFLLAPLLLGLVILFGIALAANNLPRPWGAGPWLTPTTDKPRCVGVLARWRACRV
jgi:CBS-domain-containing membrane protein